MAVPQSLSMKSTGFFGYNDTTNKWQALSVDSLGNLNVLLSPNSKVKVIDSAGTIQDWIMPEGQAPSANSMPMVLSDEQEAILSKIANSRTNIEGGGKVSVGTTQVEVTFTGTPISIIIQADKDNTGLLFIGKTGVTNAGAGALCFLEAGDSVTLDYDDVSNALYVISDTASQYFWKGCLL